MSESDNAKDSLSQFVARVLDQLSVSAWLPSAALILAVVFVLELGTVLDDVRGPRTPEAVLPELFEAVTNFSLSTAALFVVGVVVMTMITQAFEFEAIRALEGYWGTNAVVERLAGWRSARHRKKLAKLKRMRKRLLKAAWRGARKEFERHERGLKNRGAPPQLTPNMVQRMGDRALGRESSVVLTADETDYIASIDWRDSAPAEPMRRLVNVDKRLRFMPESSRVLPTRLGNILRSSEDRVGVKPIESFVQEVFDELPFSLRVEHDQERGRLDLYCSMVFVLLFVGIVALLRLTWVHALWSLGVIAVVAVAIMITYRAALASAEAYGGVLETIGRVVRSQNDSAKGFSN